MQLALALTPPPCLFQPALSGGGVNELEANDCFDRLVVAHPARVSTNL
jgi:hypothetical protein